MKNDNNSYLFGVIVALLVVFVLVFAYMYQNPYTVVEVKEVPVEVIKEVPVEIIKEVPVEVIREINITQEVIKEVCNGKEIKETATNSVLDGCAENYTKIIIQSIEDEYYIDFKNKKIPNQWYEFWGGKPKKTYSNGEIISAFLHTEVANVTNEFNETEERVINVCYLIDGDGLQNMAVLQSLENSEVCAKEVVTNFLGTRWQTGVYFDEETNETMNDGQWGQVPDLGDLYCDVVFDWNAKEYMPEINETEQEE